MRSKAFVLLAAALALNAAAATDVLLLPAGEFRGIDGRPHEVRTWSVSDVGGKLLADKLNARHAGHVEFNFDYEHQAVLAPQNGHPAPASGWAKQFEWRPGQGLYALNVRWTAKAKAHIEALEYRYISPAIVFDKKTGVVTDLINAALVSRPNLDMQDLASAQLAALNSQFFQPEQSMTLAQQLRAALGLADSADDAAILSAVTANAAAVKSAASQHTALCTALAIDATQTHDQAIAAVAQLKSQAGLGASSTHAMATLQAEVAQLRQASLSREVEGLVTAALAAGKLFPVQKDWAIQTGMANLKTLTDYIASAPVVTATLSQQQSQAAGTQRAADGTTGAAGLDATELNLCAQLGTTPEEFAKTKTLLSAKASA